MTISMPEEMYDYIMQQSRIVTASEYIRSLVRRERERRADYASRPRRESISANASADFGAALIELEKLRAILERKDPYGD